jgi:hypothetical protein
VLRIVMEMYQVMSPVFNRSNILKDEGQEDITDQHGSGCFVKTEVLKMIQFYFGPLTS